MRFYKKETKRSIGSRITNPIADMLEYRNKDGRPIGLLMGDAVKSGINMILMIGGFIILFSVTANVLKISGLLRCISVILARAIPFDAVTPEIISSFLIGFLEVTNGVKECASLQVPLMHKAVMVSFMIGFGGLSVNAQVMSIISETDLKMGIYLVFKIIQGIIAAIYSFILAAWFSDMQVFRLYGAAYAAVRNPGAGGNFLGILMNSTICMLYILAFMLVVSIIKIKRLLHQSL